jgi:RepB DNA-primase N-terminal domain
MTTRYLLCTREEFFLSVWPRTLLRDETVELRVLRRDPTRVHRRQFFKSIPEFLKEVDRYVKKPYPLDLYFGVCTRRNNKSTKEDCFRVKTMWVDIDGTKEIQDRVASLGEIRPDFIVDSGGGMHLYWNLHSPIVLREERWIQVEAVNRSLCNRLSGDIAAIDITRILRIPGTQNFKYIPSKKVKVYKRAL